jgi:hypothetical protein
VRTTEGHQITVFKRLEVQVCCSLYTSRHHMSGRCMMDFCLVINEIPSLRINPPMQFDN